MEIENETIDIEKYSTITICSPVWVFGPCAPVREFLLENKGKIKKMRVVITHFQFYSMKNVVNKIEEIAGIKAEEKKKRRNKDWKSKRRIHNMIISFLYK